MAKVLSIQPFKRFEDAGVAVPSELDFVFKNVLAEDEIISACKGMEFLLLPAIYPPITARILENIPTVRMIQSSGVGYNTIDISAAAQLNIPVANSPGQNTMAVAEFTIALIVILQRHILVADREIKAGNYLTMREVLLRTGMEEIGGIHLGIVGFGAIGKHVARIRIRSECANKLL